MDIDGRDADGVTRFCRQHDISPSFGRGPRFMRAGDRRIISREAGADWRRELEAATA
jgi:hypothetical protein